MLPGIPGYTSEDNLSSKIKSQPLQVTLFLVGAVLVGLGMFFVRKDIGVNSSKIKIIEEESGGGSGEIAVEVAGAVESPGVYKLSRTARIEDLLIAAGGLSADADRNWMEKSLNRAAKVTDGQRIYIPAR